MSHPYDGYWCKACDTEVHPKQFAQDGDRYNYNNKMIGPFCDKCFFFVKELDVLHGKIVELENAKSIE